MADIDKIFEKLKPFYKDLKKDEAKNPEGRIQARVVQNLYHKHYGKAVKGPDFGHFMQEFLGYTKKRNQSTGGRYYIKERYVGKPPFYLKKKDDS